MAHLSVTPLKRHKRQVDVLKVIGELVSRARTARTALARGATRRGVATAIALSIGAAVIAGSGVATGASTANTTVSVTVASATSLSAAGCASGTANITDFGTVLPATSNVTSADCTVVFGSSNDTSMLRAYQTDTTGSAMLSFTDGSLDTTFDGDGKVTTAIFAGHDGVAGVALQPDGKIIVAGRALNGAAYDFAVARYNANGSLDATFDTDGKATTPILAGHDYGTSVALQPDGKIVLAGYAWNGTDDDFAVARYNPSGALDTTFDTDGMQTTAMLAGLDQANGVAIQADGKIVLAGRAHNGANDDFAIARFNTNGSLDTNFDGDGRQTTPILAAADTANGVAIQTDGKIVAAGSAWAGFDDVAIARYNPDGTLDTTFDSDGKQTTAIGAAVDTANAVAIRPDGKIVLAGSAVMGGAADFAVVRYDTNGALDTTFDSDGKQTTAILATNDYATASVLQPDGKIVLAGRAHNGTDFDFALARYNANGTLDTTLDGDGKQTTPVLAAWDGASSVAVQTDGNVIVAGTTAGGSNDDFALVRYGGGVAVSDWAGDWANPGLFGACLHTVANASATWTLAGSGNCTTAINANWNALPTTASKIAWGASGVTNATANLRYGFKATASQKAGSYVAPLTFEVVAPNA